MEATPPKELARTDVRADLQASLAARRELDPEMEEHLIATFLARIERQIDARVDERLEDIRADLEKAHAPDKPSHKDGDEVAMVAGSFALAIPLMFVAGIFLHGAGVIAVMAGVVLVNVLYFVAQVERRRG